jgi:hypothetical protein
VLQLADRNSIQAQGELDPFGRQRIIISIIQVERDNHRRDRRRCFADLQRYPGDGDNRVFIKPHAQRGTAC